MVNLKRKLCKSKISLENDLETLLPSIPTFLGNAIMVFD
jgi:hypothetical protein